MDPFARLIIATLLICGAWFGVRHHSRRRRGDARRQVEMIARLGLAKGVSVTVVRIAGRGLVPRSRARGRAGADPSARGAPQESGA
ncbi:MAG: hypothetical protein E6G66_13015 [Actinobacteria bacterium]|nr:MAG: hypothetical protein E6G66_13015 [Actinomycetota bacterium]